MAKRIITEQEIEKFKENLLEAEKSLNTVKKYVCDVRKLQKYIGQNILTKQLLTQYKDYLKYEGKYKINSINSFITAINSFCNIMGWHELCIKTIKMQRTVFEAEEKELTMDEYKKMVYTAMECEEEKIALIIQTIAGTGIRVGELCYIDVECLDTGVVDIYNKGKARRILLPSDLIAVLKRYVRKQNINEGVIFQNRRKQPIDRKEVWYLMKKAAAKAKIPKSKVFPHNLRHLFAKQFYYQTGDIAMLSDILGHSSIEITRIYIKTTGIEHKKQLDKMNMIFTNNTDLDKNSEDIKNKSSIANKNSENNKGKLSVVEKNGERNKNKSSVANKNSENNKEKSYVANRNEFEKKNINNEKIKSLQGQDIKNMNLDILLISEITIQVIRDIVNWIEIEGLKNIKL